MDDARKKKRPPARTGAGDKPLPMEETGGRRQWEGETFAREVFKRAIDALHREWSMRLEERA